MAGKLWIWARESAIEPQYSRTAAGCDNTNYGSLPGYSAFPLKSSNP
ncbi:hypothetical protein [Microcoleus sp. A006_D1]